MAASCSRSFPPTTRPQQKCGTDRDGALGALTWGEQAKTQIQGETMVTSEGAESDAGESSGPGQGSARSLWVFLAHGRFVAKTPANEGWIYLDFLGFSRQNRDFSLGYAE